MVKRTIRPTKERGFKENVGLWLVLGFLVAVGSYRAQNFRSPLPPPVAPTNPVHSELDAAANSPWATAQDEDGDNQDEPPNHLNQQPPG